MEPSLHRVVLETSLKPFRSLAPEAIERTCLALLTQWRPLTSCFDQVGILLWVGDGSEFVLWRGHMGDAFPWGKFIGFSNMGARPYPGDPAGYQPQRLYTEEPPDFTYADLARVIATYKRVSLERFGQPLFVGATIDPGPEFVDSDWKFSEHTELLVGGPHDQFPGTFAFVDAKRTLHADTREYAAYPQGIPEGTSLGTFLGRQCASALPALGYDYLWLSNGMGFSAYGWYWTGENLDGERFGTADWDAEADKILAFWRDFRREYPQVPIEVRGTNYSVGVDLAAHCVPHSAIYREGRVSIPPVNPPWGSVDIGLEMAAYMTRIARLPGEFYAFRAYINDPWFWTNPWWDYYNRQPYDIYTPLSVARINGQGQVETPRQVEFLTCDTEKGEYQEDCALEVIPHVRRALARPPDAPGLLTWLYPYDELQATTRSGPAAQERAYFVDLLVRGAINAGLPLNTVLSTTELLTVPAECLRDTLLVAPLPLEGEAYVPRLLELLQAGQEALFYGPVAGADARLLALLNLQAADTSLAGELQVEPGPSLEQAGPRRLIHRPRLCAGGVSAVLAAPDDALTTVQAVVTDGIQRRVYALTRQGDGLRLAWLRGTLGFDLARWADDPTFDDPEQVADSCRWMVDLLAAYGYRLDQERASAHTPPLALAIARHRGGLIFNGFKADSTVNLWLRFSEGVPVLTEKQVLIREGRGRYALERWFHEECRVLVEQAEGVVSCKEMQHPTGTTRRLRLSGLRGARVTIYPYPEAVAGAEVAAGAGAAQVTRLADRLVVAGADDVLTVTW